MKATLVVGLYFALSLLSSTADATLIEQDFISGNGDGLVTFDSQTGLRWLDLSASAGRSFNEVSTEFGLGGDFEGFRYATNEEILMLWQNAGLVDIDLAGFGNFTEANYIPARNLIDLIGSTSVFLSQTTALGISGTPEPLHSQNRFTPQLELLEYAQPFTAEARTNGIINVSYSLSTVGSWLVQPATIPESSTLYLIVGGFASLVLFRHRGKGRRLG